MTALQGDWIIKGVAGELHTRAWLRTLFARSTYEAADCMAFIRPLKSRPIVLHSRQDRS